MNFVISHSSWEVSKIKSSKTNRWIIIVTDYQTWTGKLQFFWYIDFWISDFSTFKTELESILLSNINDGDNNEKTKNVKTGMGMFKNMGGNIPGGNFLGGNFPGREFDRWEFSGWEFSWYQTNEFQFIWQKLYSRERTIAYSTLRKLI